MKKNALIAVLSASIMCAAAAVTFAACDDDTKYKVTYEGGGTSVTGTAPTEADHAKDEKFKLAQNSFVYADHVFDGWKYGEQTLEAGAEFTMPEKDVTFTAQWLELFTVTYEWGTEHFEATGVTIPDAVEVANGKTTTLPTIAAQEGYEFKGWLIGTATTEQAGGTTYTVTGDVTATAVFAANAYDVSYNLGEEAAEGQAANYPTAQKAYGSKVDLPTTNPTPTNPEDVFLGWEVKQGETPVTVENDSFTMPNGAVTITAKWAGAEDVWTVSFYTSEESGATAYKTVKVLKNGKLSSLPTEPTQDNYRFDKWVTKADSTETPFTTDITISADTSVYAKWVQQVKVTFSLGEGEANHAAAGVTAPVVDPVDINGKITLPAAPAAAEGYEFAGWKVGDTETVLAADAKEYTDIAASITLTAQWDTKSYDVEYSFGEGDANHAAANQTPPATEQKKYTTEVTLSTMVPEAVAGFKFIGWEVKQDNNPVTVNEENKFVMPAGKVTITAKWGEEVTVTFKGETDVEVKVGKGAEIGDWSEKVTNPTKDENDFTFEGWYVGETKLTAEYVVNEDVNATPKYHLEVGKKDHTNGYPAATTAWQTAIQLGEKVELKGTMTSKGLENHQTVVAYVFSNTAIASFFRADNFILEQTNLETAENWTIVKDESEYRPGEYITTAPAHSVNLVKIFASCDITVTLNWISASKMVLSIKTTGNTAENNTLSSTSAYVIAPKEGQSFAASYKLGLNAENAYAEFTEFTRHTHSYSATTDKCECGILNPNHGGEGGLPHNYENEVCTICGKVDVEHHTIHRYANGVCSICNKICLHTNTNGSACTDCGATLANSSLTVNNTNWWSSGESADKNIEIGVNDMLIFNMQYSNFAAAEWAGAILTIRDSNNTLLWVNRYIDGWNNKIADGKSATMPTDGNTMVHNTHDNTTLPETRLQIIVLRGENGVMKVICNKYAKDDASLATVLVTRTFELTGFTEASLKFGISSADGSAFVSDTVNVVKATYTA